MQRLLCFGHWSITKERWIGCTTLHLCLVTAFIVLINKQTELSQLALLHSSSRGKYLTWAVVARQFLHSKFRTSSDRNYSIVLEPLTGQTNLVTQSRRDSLSNYKGKLEKLLWLMTSVSKLPFAFLERCPHGFHTKGWATHRPKYKTLEEVQVQLFTCSPQTTSYLNCSVLSI